MKRTTMLLAALFSLAAVAGCSDKSGGNPTPETTTPPASTETETSSAPSGPELDLSKFTSKPCDVLTADQLAGVSNVRAPKTRTAPLGPTCNWESQDILKDTGFGVTLGADQKFDSLLGNSRTSPIFTESKVSELRAFNFDSTDGTRDCSTVVETGKNSVIIAQAHVALQQKGIKKPCEESQKIAAAVISTLKG
ncbi:DUF3558 domain-containing protein [Lentzea sp. NPDC042327]|uniref:DUF3558 domain-containing protein n=1 Tax=Lentzea sp. NPDC042327 TaxID=3154801 RepID=UPI0033D6EE9B